MKTLKLGNYIYVLPFVVNGHWVDDARGNTVAEARNRDVAKGLAEFLNAAAASLNAQGH